MPVAITTTVTVRVLPHRSISIRNSPGCSVHYGAGQTILLPADEARLLIEQHFVEDAKG